jgi:hypothetical protein
LVKEVVGVNETTRHEIADVIVEGLRRRYSTRQIAFGEPSEDYGGVAGVFDSFDHDRAGTIARTETATAVNLATLAGYANQEIARVEVFDGVIDAACAAANGAVWDLSRAVREPISHPNCVRAFAPIE